MKDDLLYINRILECILKIERYTQAGAATFLADTMISDAVIRNLQVLAESSKRISDAIKEQHPDIAWRGVAGFRNILVPDYLGVDLPRIWSIVTTDLPVFKQQMDLLQAQYS